MASPSDFPMPNILNDLALGRQPLSVIDVNFSAVSSYLADVTNNATVGTQGIQGSSGIQGYDGFGLQGSIGIQGYDGSQGTIGVQGLIGSGVRGIQGIQGLIGVQGLIGSGVRGIQGIQGPSGSGGGGGGADVTVGTLLHCDGTNGSTVLVNKGYEEWSNTVPPFNALGTASLSNSQYKFGTASLSFGSSAGYALGSASQAYVPGNLNTDFTFECWLYLTSYGTGGYLSIGGCIIDTRSSGSGTDGYLLLTTTSGNVVLYTGGTQLAQTSGTLPLNTWVFFAFTQNNGVCYFYLDGVQDSVTYTNTYNWSGSNYCYLGIPLDRTGTGLLCLSGSYMDEVRFSRGIARYTDTFTPPSSAFPDPSSGGGGGGGSQGTTGAQGIQGTTGIGTQGVQGTTGIGTQGVQGTTGIGTQGVIGSQGIQGPSGSGGGGSGSQGTTGTQGVQGITGIQGTQGIQGRQGITGLQGLTGIQGTIGTQGTTGTAGTLGTQGIQGRQGTTGSQGLTGTQGITGTGVQGIQGTIGSQGSIGIQGTQGTQGTTGTGIQGVIGSQGIQGTQGIQGRQGITGIGSQGTTGSQGLQGITGIQGTTGTSIQGTTGSQGLIGTQGITGFGSIYTAYKPGNSVVVTANTPITDSDLTINNLSSGTYYVETFLLPSDAGTGAGFEFFFTVNGGSDSFYSYILDGIIAGTPITPISLTFSNGTPFSSVTGTNSLDIIKTAGVLHLYGSSSYTVSVEWGMVNQGGSGTTYLYAGSMMRITKL